MAALAPFVGMPVAFKLGTALPVFLLPPLTYAAFRLMGFRFPGPLLGAGAAAVFLFLEENPIWGGTIASTLTGEFSYTYGIGLAVLFLGLVYRYYTRGKGPLRPRRCSWASWPSPTATPCSGPGCPRPTSSTSRAGRWRTLGFLAVVAAPRLRRRGRCSSCRCSPTGATRRPTTTPGSRSPPAGSCPRSSGRSSGVAARRPRGHVRSSPAARAAPTTACCSSPTPPSWGPALAAAGPALGVIDVRFVPFAQLAAVPRCGAPPSASLLERARARAPRRPRASCSRACSTATRARSVLRYWIDWNYTGLEAKELWPAFRQTGRRARRAAGRSSGRGGVQRHPRARRAPSACTRRCRSSPGARPSRASTTRRASPPTPSTTSPPSSGPPRPTPSRRSSTARFDTDAAARPPAPLQRARRRGAVAPAHGCPRAAGATRPSSHASRPTPSSGSRAGRAATSSPFTPSPVRSSLAGWREKALRWFSRRPLPRRSPRLHRGCAGRRWPSPIPGCRRPREPLERRSRGAGDGRGGSHHDSDEPARPSAAGEGGVPPALARGGRTRALPRAPGAHAGGARSRRRCASPTRARRRTGSGLAAEPGCRRRRGRWP